MYKKIILIDFSWVYNKYYFVAKQQYPEDTLEQELYRMLNQFLHRVKQCYENTKVFVVLDSATKDTGNFKLNENYKQNRDKEAKKEVYKVFNSIVKDLSSSLGLTFSFIKAKGYEADQVIAYLTKEYHEKYPILIYSGDKDLIQLTAYSNTCISDKFLNGEFQVKTDKEIFEKFKNSKGEDFTRISENKRDILKYRSLKGDPSDNLKPVFPRIKDKEIIDIIKSYWIDDLSESLTVVRANDIIDNIEGFDNKLAAKLREHVQDWVTNYKIMSLYDVEEMEIKRL